MGLSSALGSPADAGLPVALSQWRAQLSPDLGVARLGALRSLPDVLAQFAVTLPAALHCAELPADLLVDPERGIDALSLGRLLTVCTKLTGCAHFGALLGSHFCLDDFAALGGLLRNSPTVGDAVDALLLNLYVLDRLAAPLLLNYGPHRVMLGYALQRHGMQAQEQLLDTATAVAYRLLRELCGPAWRPTRVLFAHARPASEDAHRRLFGTHLSFDAEASGVVFDRAWLARPISGANPQIRKQCARLLQQAGQVSPLSFAAQVECALQQIILSHDCSAHRVAQCFGIEPRALRLRLHKAGTSFQCLLDQVRFELAKQLLQNTRLPLAQIAAALNYADSAVFSRAFKQWAGISPLRWRKAQQLNSD